ncbi:CPBP family intramembrane glutamic endopeptidase [Ruminococcus sp. XPD3002]|uniref:CPBP family intramembrane glutamic endopeptidase n=1 Tax=Ruminococcus sp. XPD3002 TaxID=1452269 RepID=UPI000916BE0D|nr:CAAX protease self-immunity [Ruminococcus flavefaciens]
MKNLLCTLKYCLVLLILCIFPFCIALVTEYAISGETAIVSNYLVMPMTLIGAIISAFVFKREGVFKLKNRRPSLKEMVSVAGIGLAFKPLILCILHFAVSLGLTNSGKNNIVSFIIAVFVAAVAEELIFRGILSDIINISHSEQKLNTVITIAITSVLWAASHLYGFSLYTILLIIDGIILGLIYHRYKSILLCIIYHAANNAAVIILGQVGQNHWIPVTVAFTVILAFSLCIIICSYKSSDALNHTVREQ